MRNTNKQHGHTIKLVHTNTQEEKKRVAHKEIKTHIESEVHEKENRVDDCLAVV